MGNQVVIKPGIGHLDQAYSDSIVHPTLQAWNCLGVTPNFLTTLGVVSSMAGMKAYYDGERTKAVALVLLRMYFDYVDGMYARKYNMTSAGGDVYDHFSDVTFMAVFVFVTWKVYPKSQRLYVLGVLLLSAIALCIHISCVELECGDDCDDGWTLSITEGLNGVCGGHGGIFKVLDNSALYLVVIAIIIGMPREKHFVGPK